MYISAYFLLISIISLSFTLTPVLTYNGSDTEIEIRMRDDGVIIIDKSTLTNPESATLNMI